MTEQRALPRVHLGGVVGVEGDAPVALEQVGDAPVAEVRGRLGLVHRLVQAPAADRRSAESPSSTWAHLSSTVDPGTRLVVAMAPAFTSGFMVRLSLSSTAMTESNGRPVAFVAEQLAGRVRRRSASHTSANTNGLDTLWMENGMVASPTEIVWPATPDDARTEGVR